MSVIVKHQLAGRISKILVVALCATALQMSLPAVVAQDAPGGTWKEVTPTENLPGARMDPSMAFDRVREETVMFGGFQSAQFFDDTWLWNGTAWTNTGATGPSARRGAGMAFYSPSPETGEMVLFGGGDRSPSSFNGETWTWNGTLWTNKLIAGPTPRMNAAMVFDEARGQVVLFGGEAGVTLNDTWIYDGVNWTLVPTDSDSTPPARGDAAIGYDRITGKVILYGGYTSILHNQALGDTWSWDGTGWTREFPENSPSPRGAADMAWDGSELVLFGGSAQDQAAVAISPYRETWTWNGVGWVDRDPDNSLNPKPEGRIRHAMAFDDVREEAILFAGRVGGAMNDSWRWRKGEDFSPTSSITIGNAQNDEGNSGTSEMIFNVVMGKSVTMTVTATYETLAGTATNNIDFVPSTGTVVFEPGETFQTATVLAKGDTTGEVDETFYVRLVSAENADVAAVRGRGVIANDDGDPTGPGVSIGDVTVQEVVGENAPAHFPVTMTQSSASTVTLTYYTMDGSAVAPSDYSETTGTVTFSPGQTLQTITVSVMGDSMKESTEKFFVFLSNPFGAHIFRETGQGTILHSDPNTGFDPGGSDPPTSGGSNPGTSLPPGAKGGPDASSWDAGRIDLFAQGSDDQLIHRWYNDGAWGGWEGLGGQLTADPTAVSWGTNRIDVFVRGTDGGMWHRWWDGSSWQGYEGLGGQLVGGPDAASWQAGRLDIFARGTDNALWHTWYDGTWHGWESLGGEITSDPTAVSWGPNRLDVFARGTDNAIWQISYSGTSWSGWSSRGGAATSAPEVSSWASGRLDLFVRGTDNAIWQFTYGGVGYGSLGGVATSDPGAISWGPNRIDLFIKGTDNAIWHAWWDGSSWNGYESLGAR